MPYQSRDDLPTNIQKILPSHAQDIYLKAFNSAYKEYANPERRDNQMSLEELCARIAWAAVKKEYEKNEKTGQWIKK